MSPSPKKIPEDLTQQADRIIKDYAFRSSLTGLVPIPLLDTLGLISVQRIMLIQLSRLYRVPFKKNLVSISLSTLTSGITANMATPLVGSMLKLIPGIGTVVGGASVAALSSASTYAVGKVFQQHFENGGTLENFNPEAAKQDFEEQLIKAKEIEKREAEKAKSE